MKKIVSIIIIISFILPFAVSASEITVETEAQYDRTYYRYNDYVSAVNEEQEKLLNTKAQSRITELEMDFPICVFNTLSETKTLREFADDFYERNKFGYGENKSGIFLVLDLKNNKVAVYYYGDAKQLITDEDDDRILDDFLAGCKDDNKTYYDIFDEYIDNVYEIVEKRRKEPPTTTATAIDKSDNVNGMPYWYPLEYKNFKDFHGEDLPLVVDDADIFTKEQIAELTNKIQAMKDKYGIGYVAFTDDDNHGLKPEAYSSDFLHFNGYGVGDGYGAVVFYLSLDPVDRCWLTTSINTYENIFTRSVTYDIDELVDSDIRAGRYYEAFLKHADFVDKLFSKFTEDLPEWYPKGAVTYEIDRENREYASACDLSKPRIVDNAGLFDEKTANKYTTELAELSKKYDVDLIVFTDNKTHTVYSDDYADDFYYYNGYKKDGLLLYIFTDSTYDVIFYGKCYLEYENLMYEFYLRLYDDLHDGNYVDVIDDFADNADFLLGHGRLPVTVGVMIFCTAIGLIFGLVAGAIHSSNLVSKMKIAIQISAAEYLVNGSLDIRSRNSVYSYSTVTKTRRQTESSSSGGGRSGGGSSYSSGRSSGGSYSSGGRRF